MAIKELDEEAIFNVARRIETQDARNSYLQQVCGADRTLLKRVTALLRAHDDETNFLEQPAVKVTATFDVPPVSTQVGTTIGPYKLLEQIGEGGMGVVYMAEQQQPVRRMVALKVIKPGTDTKEVIARFDVERQALALMDHPNIARILDAGTTETGRPYFVMDMVRGIPITTYCDQQQLDPRQRLELFVTVCRAVQHAHQKGVIHRDLKPTNVLVELHDVMSVPKVIDFGVAKAINQRFTKQSLFTQFSQMLGSPLYMSPEQAQLTGVNVDTRSDVYSLGVLLYELLTGTTPFDKQALREAPYDEIRRIIQEEEPPRPSARISTLGALLSTVSESRTTDPRRLAGLCRASSTGS